MSTVESTTAGPSGDRLRFLARGALVLALAGAVCAVSAGGVLMYACLTGAPEEAIRELIVVKLVLTAVFVGAVVHAWRKHKAVKAWEAAQRRDEPAEA